MYQEFSFILPLESARDSRHVALVCRAVLYLGDFYSISSDCHSPAKKEQPVSSYEDPGLQTVSGIPQAGEGVTACPVTSTSAQCRDPGLRNEMANTTLTAFPSEREREKAEGISWEPGKNQHDIWAYF